MRFISNREGFVGNDFPDISSEGGKTWFPTVEQTNKYGPSALLMAYLFSFDMDFLYCPCLCFNTAWFKNVADSQKGKIWKEM